MSKNNIPEGVKAFIEKSLKDLSDTRRDLRSYTNYERSVERHIMDYVETYNIQDGDVEGLHIEEVAIPQKIPLKSILDVFPSDTDVRLVLENIVGEITIDLEKTAENLRFSANFQEPIVKSEIKQLEKLTNVKEKKVL